MARITVDDCLLKIKNRFALVLLAAKRVQQLDRGLKRLVKCKNKNVVAALREIAAGKVWIHEKGNNKKKINSNDFL